MKILAYENDRKCLAHGDKLVITFPEASYQHSCGKVDLSNVPGFYEQSYRQLSAGTVSTKASPKLGAPSRATATSATTTPTSSKGTPNVEILSA